MFFTRMLLLVVLALGIFAPAVSRAQMPGKSIMLVASAQMKDPRFHKTVLVVTRHGRSPPLGVIINRPLEATLATLFPKLPAQEAQRRLFLGGPVATNMIAFLFRSPTGSEDAIAITEGMHLGRSGVTLSELLRGGRPHTGLRVFVGYAGWSEGQLEAEIQRGGWHVLPVDQEVVFDKDIELIWPEMIRRATMQTVSFPPSNLTGNST